LEKILDADLCNNQNAISCAYENGVPMGGTLNSNLSQRARIFISASADQSLEDQFIEKFKWLKALLMVSYHFCS